MNKSFFIQLLILWIVMIWKKNGLRDSTETVIPGPFNFTEKRERLFSFSYSSSFSFSYSQNISFIFSIKSKEKDKRSKSVGK